MRVSYNFSQEVSFPLCKGSGIPQTRHCGQTTAGGAVTSPTGLILQKGVRTNVANVFSASESTMALCVSEMLLKGEKHCESVSQQVVNAHT